ncbi:hypothetical protein QQF64_012568 [Cirrhinus molitorella]|uniref:Uncharacterized protein n=1 Tax=Cirrhinus molitorella TaxID=172907 RepID=A0ABR3LW23_9TELE
MESESRKPLAIVSIHDTVYLSPPEQSRASALQRALRGWEHTFRAVCEDRKNASRKRDAQLTGAFLRLFISQPGCVHWFACGAHWSFSSPQTTRPPERERGRHREMLTQTADAAGY